MALVDNLDLLSAKECAALANVKKERWLRMHKRGETPQAVNPASYQKLWRRIEVLKWLAGPDSLSRKSGPVARSM